MLVAQTGLVPHLGPVIWGGTLLIWGAIALVWLMLARETWRDYQARRKR